MAAERLYFDVKFVSWNLLKEIILHRRRRRQHQRVCTICSLPSDMNMIHLVMLL